MSKILITGNGFDLFHGLPTKYGHFMGIMKTIEGNNLVVNSWYKYFNGVLEIETWIDFENELENALKRISIIFNEIKERNIDHYNYYLKRRANVFYHLKKDETDNYTDIIQNISRHFNRKKLMREKIVNKTLCKPLPQIQLPKK